MSLLPLLSSPLLLLLSLLSLLEGCYGWIEINVVVAVVVVAAVIAVVIAIVVGDAYTQSGVL